MGEVETLRAENARLRGDVRSYEITFGMMHETAAERDVLAERRRQVEAEGWSHEHDDSHELGELALAAALYAVPYETRVGGEPLVKQADFVGLHMALETVGEWNLKPEPNRRRRLVKAGALILAEIERLDRLSKAESSHGA